MVGPSYHASLKSEDKLKMSKAELSLKQEEERTEFFQSKIDRIDVS